MISPLFAKDDQVMPRLVIGLNQVDKMINQGWNERLNTPTREAEKEIKRRSENIIKQLAQYSHVSASHLEYYSALKRYRLLLLLSKIIRYAYAGFKLDNVQPADPFELADPEIQEFAEQERKRRRQRRGKVVSSKAKLLDEMSQILSSEEIGLIKKKLLEERKRPPKVAVLGKTGVGKTTTINNLFNVRWKTSHTSVGTIKAQMKEFELATGGTLSVVDLPGYGRSIAKDREYEEIYRQIIPSCDLVFFVLQANSRDLADDQEMILKIIEWLKHSPNPLR